MSTRKKSTQVLVLDYFIDHWATFRFLPTRGSGVDELRDSLRECRSRLADRRKRRSAAEMLSIYKRLWGILLRYAFQCILPGCPDVVVERFLGYHEKAMEFDKILFGAKKYYRDHIIHSLWVYLLGEYFIGAYLADEKPASVGNARSDVRRRLWGKVHAAWCITALCHDLGYPLEATGLVVGRANELLELVGVAPQFTPTPADDTLWLSLTQIRSALVEDIIPLAAQSFHATKGRSTSRIWHACDRSKSEQLASACRTARATSEGEEHRHGLAGAFIVHRLAGLRDTFTRRLKRPAGTSEKTTDLDFAVSTSLWSNILYAIATHSGCNKHRERLDDLAALLVLADGLAECREARKDKPWHVFERIWDIEGLGRGGETIITYRFNTAARQELSADPDEPEQTLVLALEAIKSSIPGDWAGSRCTRRGKTTLRVQFTAREKRPTWLLLARPFWDLTR